MTVIDCVTGYKLDMYSPSISGKPCSITANLSGYSELFLFDSDARISGTTITAKSTGDNDGGAIIHGLRKSKTDPTRPQLELDFCNINLTKSSGKGRIFDGLYCLTMKRCGLDVSYQKQDLVFDGSKGYLTLNGSEIKKLRLTLPRSCIIPPAHGLPAAIRSGTHATCRRVTTSPSKPPRRINSIH